MDESRVVSAAITSDENLLQMVRETITEDGRITLAAEITRPFPEITREEIVNLRELDPRLFFLDLHEDPEAGIRLANFLSEGNPNRRFIGMGPELESGLLIEAMRAGMSEYLPKPITREDLLAAIHRVERKVLGGTTGSARAAGEIYAIFSPKGGSGSTTVATNLAIRLHQLTGKKTLLVDLDLELGEIAVLLGVQPRFNFVDMIRNFHRMDSDLMASYIEKHSSGVHLLSAPFHPEKADVVAGDGIHKILHFLKHHYDYVVVDTSKSFSPATLATFEQADRVFLLTNVDLPSLRNIKRCQPLLDRIVGSDTERVRLVVNRFNVHDPISLDEVQKTLGMKVYATLANDYESVIRSINSGKPVIDNEKSIFARDLRSLAAQISGVQASSNGGRSQGSRWPKLFNRDGVKRK